jgi:hypothetical protein
VKSEAVWLSTEDKADLRHARIYAYQGKDYTQGTAAQFASAIVMCYLTTLRLVFNVLPQS